ncbi:hypothetical protein BVI1335_1270051 [Burkholderia vietnamiensis]|nr:hypothetical protein BVI1335_1270051 [Burkholderia vietnamiensis]
MRSQIVELRTELFEFSLLLDRQGGAAQLDLGQRLNTLVDGSAFAAEFIDVHLPFS